MTRSSFYIRGIIQLAELGIALLAFNVNTPNAVPN